VELSQPVPADEEERFRLLVEGVKDYAILMLGPDGTIVSWSSGGERIKGYRADEVIGRHFSIFYTPEAVARRHPDHELAVAKSEGRFEEEGWRVRKDGTQFWASVVITALFGPAGELRGFGKVTRDMTERRISVTDTDTGPGLEAEDLERLFVPFERLRAAESGVAGTGLGLALSKRLVELMHGTITVESAPGADSAFSVDLERTDGPDLAAGAAGDPAATPTSTSTVLYIEDNLANLHLVEMLSRAWGTSRC
jgi:PAS domain S-box-containing protein